MEKSKQVSYAVDGRIDQDRLTKKTCSVTIAHLIFIQMLLNKIFLPVLLKQTKGAKVLYALKHMDPAKLKMTGPVKAALNNALDEQKGKLEFVELVSSFKLQDRSKDLLQLALQFPDSTVGKESAKTLLDWNKFDLIRLR